jgi:hypothetical protein
VVVVPGVVWGAEALGAGSVNVFQKIFFRRLTLLNESTGAVVFEETTAAPRLFALVPDLAAETDALDPLTSPPILSLSTSSSSMIESTSSGGSSGQSVPLDKLTSRST